MATSSFRFLFQIVCRVQLTDYLPSLIFISGCYSPHALSFLMFPPSLLSGVHSAASDLRIASDASRRSVQGRKTALRGSFFHREEDVSPPSEIPLPSKIIARKRGLRSFFPRKEFRPLTSPCPPPLIEALILWLFFGQSSHTEKTYFLPSSPSTAPRRVHFLFGTFGRDLSFRN